MADSRTPDWRMKRSRIQDIIYDFKSTPKYQRDHLLSACCRGLLPDIILIIARYVDFSRNGLTEEELANIKQKMPKRIFKEIARVNKINKWNPSAIRITVHPSNYRYLLAEIPGSKGTAYEGGMFYAEIFLTEQFPMEAPKFRFLTPIHHPNVDELGRTNLTVLHSKWTPSINVPSICNSMHILTSYPATYDPVNGKLGYAWQSNIQLAYKTAKEWTQKYAQPFDLEVL